MGPRNAAVATALATAKPGPKEKKLSGPAQRQAWIKAGMCGVDGKAPLWEPKKAVKTEFGMVKAGRKSECREHFMYFKEHAAKANGKPATSRATAPKAARPGRPTTTSAKEGRVPLDMVEQITRQVAKDIGGDAIVQLAPMPRQDLYNMIHGAVAKATRVVGFRP